MERGVSTGERTEADPLIVSAGMSHRAMTMSILELADEAGYRAALIDATDATVTGVAAVRLDGPGGGARPRPARPGGGGHGRRVRPGRGQRRHRGQRDPRGGSRCLPDRPRRQPGGHRRPAQRLRRAVADHLGSAGRTRRRRRGPFPGAAGHRVRRGGGHDPVQLAARVSPARPARRARRPGSERPHG